MKDSTRRALRTLAHGVIAGLIAVPVMAAAFPTPDGRISAIVATVVAICAALTKVINTLEDQGVIPAVLKAPASDGADPVPADAGHSNGLVLLAVLVLVIAIIGGWTATHLLFWLIVLALILFLVGVL